jgi:hypothetical protein
MPLLDRADTGVPAPPHGCRVPPNPTDDDEEDREGRERKCRGQEEILGVLSREKSAEVAEGANENVREQAESDRRDDAGAEAPRRA